MSEEAKGCISKGSVLTLLKYDPAALLLTKPELYNSFTAETKLEGFTELSELGCIDLVYFIKSTLISFKVENDFKECLFFKPISCKCRLQKYVEVNLKTQPYHLDFILFFHLPTDTNFEGYMNTGRRKSVRCSN